MDLSVADSYCWIGKIHRENRDFKKAKDCFVKAHRIKVGILGKANVESAEVLHNIGIVCDDLGLHSKRLVIAGAFILVQFITVFSYSFLCL